MAPLHVLVVQCWAYEVRLHLDRVRRAAGRRRAAPRGRARPASAGRSGSAETRCDRPPSARADAKAQHRLVRPRATPPGRQSATTSSRRSIGWNDRTVCDHAVERLERERRTTSRCRSSRRRRGAPRTDRGSRPRSRERGGRPRSRARPRGGCRSSARSAAAAAHAAAERQPRDPGVRDDADRAHEPGRLRRVIELAEERAAAGPRDPGRRVDLGRRASSERSITIPSSQVERPGMLCPPQRTATRSSSLAREPNRRSHVVGVRRSDDERRAPVDHPVPHDASGVVARVAGRTISPSKLPLSSGSGEALLARARRRAASTSRSFGAPLVTSSPRRRIEASVTSSTARSNACSFACDGFVEAAILRTYCSDAARTSSSVAGGSKLKSV